MGVYIKGMTLEQFNEFMDILGGVMNPSKLIEVTEPHGDLIDRDRTIDRAKVDGARAALIYEPAVIEAEGE